MADRSEPGFLKQGTDVRIYPCAKILNPERITLGSHIIVDDFVFIGAHEKLVIGNYVHIASHTSITGGGQCVICDFVGLSSGVRVLTGSDDFLGEGLTGPPIPSPYRAVSRSKVILLPHSIVGANSVIFPGVTIGEGAAVGAGSVVTKDLEPWGVYAGHPARRLRTRPKEKILELTKNLFDEYGTPQNRYLDAGVLA